MRSGLRLSARKRERTPRSEKGIRTVFASAEGAEPAISQSAKGGIPTGLILISEREGRRGSKKEKKGEM